MAKKIPREKKERGKAIPADEHAALEAFLISRGAPPGEVQAALGGVPANRTREEIEQALTDWLRSRPKG